MSLHELWHFKEAKATITITETKEGSMTRDAAP